VKRRTVGSRIRSLGPVVAAVGAALLVTGCGAGQITQTDTQVAAINGTSAGVGTIAIRNAEVSYPETDGDGPAVYPPNSDAQTTMWLVNQGYEADELVSARTDAASQVVIEGSRVVPAQRTLVIGTDAPATSEPAGDPTRGTLTLQGLTRELRPGQMVEITLTFRDAGPVTFEMPVTVPDEPRTNPAEPGEPHGSGGH
jgi:copper(I)-binding protein